MDLAVLMTNSAAVAWPPGLFTNQGIKNIDYLCDSGILARAQGQLWLGNFLIILRTLTALLMLSRATNGANHLLPQGARLL